MRKAASLRPSPAASGAWQDRTPAFGDCAIPVTQAAGSGRDPCGTGRGPLSAARFPA